MTDHAQRRHRCYEFEESVDWDAIVERMEATDG